MGFPPHQFLFLLSQTIADNTESIALLACVAISGMELPLQLLGRIYPLMCVGLPVRGDLQSHFGPGSQALGPLGQCSSSCLAGSKGGLAGGQGVDPGGAGDRGAGGPEAPGGGASMKLIGHTGGRPSDK